MANQYAFVAANGWMKWYCVIPPVASPSSSECPGLKSFQCALKRFDHRNYKLPIPMKMNKTTRNLNPVLLVTALGSLATLTLNGANIRREAPAATASSQTAEADAAREKQNLMIKVLDPDPLPGQKFVTWLGLATEEASEALTAQLRLAAGAGLTVTYVAPDSPAAKAGLQKNDVLVELDDQSLVHPAQLRKLIQVRKEGDTVKLGYYRAGKRESATVTLGKTSERPSLLDDQSWREPLDNFKGLADQLRDRYGETLRDYTRDLQRSLGDLHIEGRDVQKEIRLSLEDARRAVEEALRHATNDLKKFGPAAKRLEDLARGWTGVGKDATVTVKSSGSSVKTVVKADDTGTYVIVANPRKRLTVHDHDGKLLFDGEIETAEQRASVPKEVWRKVEPMVEKMGSQSDQPELESRTEK
jgi:hypothetical protein